MLKKMNKILIPILKKVENEKKDLWKMLRKSWNDTPIKADTRIKTDTCIKADTRIKTDTHIKIFFGTTVS